MQRFTPQQRLFAYAVAALAGFVDVTGFLQVDGYFVSFMTGNTTLLARDLDTDLPVMRAIGVREIAGWLRGEWSREEMIEKRGAMFPFLKKFINSER